METNRINPYKLFVGSFIPNWLLRRKEISHGAKLTYARLCQFAGEDGKAYPKQQTLADEIGSSRRRVIAYLVELQKFDLIEVEQLGLGKPNTYFFLNHKWFSSVRSDTSGSVRNDTAVVPEMKLHSIKRIMEENHIPILVENIYRHYAEKVKPGGKSDAIKSINKLLKDGKTEEALLRCVDNYLISMPKDNQYKIQANNFFGKAERYKDFLNIEPQKTDSKLPTLKAGLPNWA